MFKFSWHEAWLGSHGDCCEDGKRLLRQTTSPFSSRPTDTLEALASDKLWIASVARSCVNPRRHAKTSEDERRRAKTSEDERRRVKTSEDERRRAKASVARRRSASLGVARRSASLGVARRSASLGVARRSASLSARRFLALDGRVSSEDTRRRATTRSRSKTPKNTPLYLL